MIEFVDASTQIVSRGKLQGFVVPAFEDSEESGAVAPCLTLGGVQESRRLRRFREAPAFLQRHAFRFH
jgi:hypothetical protein